MNKSAVIAVGVIAVAAVIAIGGYFAIGGRLSGPADETALNPPISGSVQNFTVFPEPVPAPLIAFETEAGEEKTLADLRGGLVLVNFWATYCGPCIRELPSLETLAREFDGDGLTVALMSQDHEGWELINTYLTRLAVATPASYLDAGKKLANELGVSSLPVTALIDAEGNILGAVTGAAEWDTPEAFDLIRYFLETPPA
ncbi:MAG: TlpA disulfide reductase family protein [Alphaproteobacteria bacterium]|nr:TlpA disulfide reductase family protein [Alphaproteobacteria bacterium]